MPRRRMPDDEEASRDALLSNNDNGDRGPRPGRRRRGGAVKAEQDGRPTRLFATVIQSDRAGYIGRRLRGVGGARHRHLTRREEQ